DLATPRLVGVRRLVGTGSDAVADRMARLALVAGRGDAVADAAVELRQARAGATEPDRVVVDAGQLVEQLRVARRERSGAEVLGVVRPVAVGADPDLEQGRLVLDDRVGGRRRERLDARSRPDEREGERQLDLAVPAGAFAVDEALPLGGGPRAGHARAEDALDVLRRRGGDLVREPHPLDLLLGLDRARLGEKRRGVIGGRERIEPGPREGGGLADHPVGRLRAERELEADLPVFGRRLAGEVERAQARWPRVARVVAVEAPEVRRPGRACGVV